MHLMIFIFVLDTVLGWSAAAPGNLTRVRRFGGPMSDTRGASPFHRPGGMGGMGGYMRHGGMGPSTGGQNRNGPGSGMFNPSGLSCIRHDIVCPKWCLVEDKNGCRSCPCGPASGMSAMAGGPAGRPMSLMSGGSRGVMPRGAMPGGAMPGGTMHGGAMPGGTMPGGTMFGGSHLPGGTSTGSHTMGGASSGGGSMNYGGGAYSSSSSLSASSSSSSYSNSGGSTAVSSHTEYSYEKPVKECAATLLCASTCTSGYQLGAQSNSGCRPCSCSNSHEVSTTTIHYITQVVKQPTRECTGTSVCMKSCTNGYTLSNTDSHGCPICTCQSSYTPPIEIAIEPPPIDEYMLGTPEVVYELTCRATSCNAGCSVGYKCGRDGCPTCDCVHPSVVGLTTLQVYVERPVQCHRPLSCPSSCQIGYKCDTSGCPTCECVVRYTQAHHYSVQTCTHTLTCASTCTNGYELIRSGSGTCDKCVCKQRVIYAVQRPQPPKQEVVRCPSTSSCSAKCSHGYEIIRYENACPKCKCKPAPVYYSLTSGGSSGCDNGCDNTGSQTVYLTGGSSSTSSGSSYYITGGNSGSSYSSGGGSAGTYITSNGGVHIGSGTNSGGSAGSYILTGSGSRGSGTSNYINSGGAECPSLPPDCDPSCIKYDTPHCRKCLCETSYSRYG